MKFQPDSKGARNGFRLLNCKLGKSKCHPAKDVYHNLLVDGRLYTSTEYDISSN